MKMASQTTVTKKKIPTLVCPITQKSVTTPHEQLAMPDSNTNWWHCPACNGWHVSSSQEEMSPPATNQLCFKPTP